MTFPRRRDRSNAAAVRSLSCCLLLQAVTFLPTLSQAWITPLTTGTTTRTTSLFRPTITTRLYEKEEKSGDGPLSFLKRMSPYESKIPEELQEEIERAEANTPAAKDRGQRVLLYALIAITGIMCAFFNYFLGDLRFPADASNDPLQLADVGFGWVEGNFLTSFFFLNKIGGIVCLLGGAGAGLLAEAELDSKRINSEKIYEELERRRDGKPKSKKQQTPAKDKKKKARGGKETKRLAALSEVAFENDTTPAEKQPQASAVPEEKANAVVSEPEEKESSAEEKKEEDKGFLGKIKDFYDQADGMAASQAILLNKSLEDAGVVDKITDETGLKVIGREQVAKLKQEKERDSKENKEQDD
jgi:hypothetical protein